MRLIIFFCTALAVSVAYADPGIPGQYEPHPDAPAGLQQFGQLAGEWLCATEMPDGEGNWVKRPHRASWNWYYINDGFAVQDVWDPLYENPDKSITPRTGTNLRVYDPETDSWKAYWAAGLIPFVVVFDVKQKGDDMVMRRDHPGNANQPPHKAKITFFNITDEKFDWRYEGASLDDQENFNEQFRLFCEKQQA